MEGAPSFLPSQELPDVQYAAFARSLDLTGIRAVKPEDVEAGRRAGLEAGGPAVIEFLTDPAVPPHATRQQMETTAESILKGDADRGPMVRQGFKSKVQEFCRGARRSDATPHASGRLWVKPRTSTAGWCAAATSTAWPRRLRRPCRHRRGPVPCCGWRSSTGLGRGG